MPHRVYILAAIYRRAIAEEPRASGRRHRARAAHHYQSKPAITARHYHTRDDADGREMTPHVYFVV